MVGTRSTRTHTSPETHEEGEQQDRAKRIQQLEAERDRLREEQRIRELEEEVELLRTATKSPLPRIHDREEDATSTDITTNSSTTDYLSSRPHSKDIKPEKLPLYNGKNTREHRE
jgi:hypothetical protein